MLGIQSISRLSLTIILVGCSALWSSAQSSPQSVLVRSRTLRGAPKIRQTQALEATDVAPAPDIWSDSIQTVAATRSEIRAAAAQSARAQANSLPFSQPVAVQRVPAASDPPFLPKHASAVSQASYSSGYVSQPIRAGHSSGACDGAGHGVSRGWGCRCGSCAPPLGATMNAFFDAQIYSGQSASQVLYQYDFNNGPNADPSQLNAAGQKKLSALSATLSTSGQPLVVEEVPRNPGLSAARRAAVLAFLQGELRIPYSDSQVIVGVPDYRGLRGVEAHEIHQNQIRNTQAFGGLGAPASSRSGGGGSTQGSGTQGR